LRRGSYRGIVREDVPLIHVYWSPGGDVLRVPLIARFGLRGPVSCVHRVAQTR